MNSKQKYSRKALWASLLVLQMAALPTQADDTEIYLEVDEETEQEYQPNVLFIFDTSGSMDGVIDTLAQYAPGTTYPYPPTVGSTPSDRNKYYVYDKGLKTFKGEINISQNNCKSLSDRINSRIASGSTDPTWYGELAYYDDGDKQGRWKQLCFTGSECEFDSSTPVECDYDQGVHGANDNTAYTKKYAANGKNGGPYKNSSSNSFSWNKTDDFYVVPANYHDWLQGPGAPRSKREIMIEEAVDLVDNFEGLNFGLMRFNGNDTSNSGSGGHVIHHFSDITPAAEKEIIKAKIKDLPATGNTPLAETLWEATRYYQGKSARWGNISEKDPNAFIGSTYKSPIENECQSNYVVLLTDGEPVSDYQADSSINGVTFSNCKHGSSDGHLDEANETCLDDLAGYLATQDQSSDIDEDQTVSTFTIGFDIDLDLLNATAYKGQGNHYSAENAQDLKAAFNRIIKKITEESTGFSAPAVSVSAYNNLQHRNELYYALFAPSLTPQWSGNIKRYKITPEGDVVDSTGRDAISPTTGFFSDTAKSWWSGKADGKEISEGGAAEQLDSASKTYVYTGEAAPINVLLNTDAHILTADNSNLTNQLMGLDETETDEYRQSLIRWARGEDVDGINDGNTHKYIADPLHTRPVVVTYGGTDADNSDDTVYAMTNLGMLHAIDTDTGNELFRFMPQTLLPNIDDFYRDEDAPEGESINKKYGLDGHISVWRQESDDEDKDIEPAEGDKVYLYFGMRRGGSNYYALDVTDRYNPKLLWRIEGGEGDFSDMGQTWSAPKLSSVKWKCDAYGENCTEKKVLIFGGGYDEVHDPDDTEENLEETLPETELGSAIYMVDATTGELIWSAGKSGHDLTLPIENSIPSDITLGDLDGDGSVDVAFAIDVLGHIWRVDFDNEAQTVSDFATGGMIADISGDNGLTTRRFYYTPDVAAISPPGETSFFALAVGSGYRAHPKEETNTDYFYVIYNESVFGPPTDDDGNIKYTKATIDDLLDATSTVADRSKNAANGYYIKLDVALDEKVLSKATIFAGNVFFTAYSPLGEEQRCGTNIGTSDLYSIDILTGEGALNDDRNIDLKHGGIAASPVIIFVDDGDGGTSPVLCVGTECFKDGDEGVQLKADSLMSKTYWREQ